MQRTRFRSARYFLAVVAALMSLALPVAARAHGRSHEVITYAASVSIECDAAGTVCEFIALEAYSLADFDAICVTRGQEIIGQQPDEDRFETGCVEGPDGMLGIDARLTSASVAPVAVPLDSFVCYSNQDGCVRDGGRRAVTVSGAWNGIGSLSRQPFHDEGSFGPCSFAVRGTDVFRDASATITLNGVTHTTVFGFMARGYESLNFFNNCTRGLPSGR
jgi:hypothetical protein